VFDTTASNTGRWRGACALIESFLRRAILWIPCRHHIYELHIKHVAECVTGQTKDPGVKIFRRLKAAWNSLEIDYAELVKFSWEDSDPWLCQIAQSVLIWARQRLLENTFPRDDYKELIALVVIWLGEDVDKFTFMHPGPDHHARWMAKAISFLKLSLLQSQFTMDDDERTCMNRMANFVGLFYAKAFLESRLNVAAPRNDIKFMADIYLYSEYDQGVSDACMTSCQSHTWYLTPQLVILSLVDEDKPTHERELIGQKLFETERPQSFQSGKPELPTFDYDSGGEPELRNLVRGESWLMFDLLGLDEPQEWLQTPAHMWDKFSGYKKFLESARSLHVINDVAERGIKLISDFIPMCHDEEQRQALLQCVEDHRNRFPNFNKTTLAKL